MTDQQVLQLLKSAGVESVEKEGAGRRLLLHFRSHGFASDVTLTNFRTDLQKKIRSLEEQKQDTLKNTFASRVIAEFSMGGSAPIRMEALKRDDQLTREERDDKSRKLVALDAEMKQQRTLLLALSHLQVHMADLLPLLRPRRTAEKPMSPQAQTDGREVWDRGVKAAARHCLSEGKRFQADETALLEICRLFLERYLIKGEPSYTAEQLLNNARQIRLLDTLE